MNRPEIRIIDNQQIDTRDVDVNSSEASYLLAKYGFKQSFSNTQPTPIENNLSFEEMVRQEESNKRKLESEKIARLNGPKAITFNNGNVNYSERKYISDDDNQLGFSVEIVTDMKIN